MQENANHHYLFFKKFHFLRYFKYFILLLFLLTISEILDYKLTTFETIKIKIAYKICRERNKVKNGAYIVLLKLYLLLQLIDLGNNRFLSLLGLDEIKIWAWQTMVHDCKFPPNYCFPNKFQMLSCNLLNPTKTYRIHLKVSFLGSALDFCKVTAPMQD